MAVLNVRANTVLATTGSTWSGTQYAVDDSFGVSSSGSFAVFNTLAANAVGTIDLGFGSQLTTGLPSGATTTSVTVYLKHAVTIQVTRFVSITVQPFDGAVAVAAAAPGTIVLAQHIDTLAFTIPTATLRSATFKMRVSATRYNGTNNSGFQLDYVDLSVGYTVAAAGRRVERKVAGAWVPQIVEKKVGGAWVPQIVEQKNAGVWS